VNDNDILPAAFQELQRAWNSGNGAQFGEPFAEDADFVDIRGTRHHGKGAIAGGHQGILDSIYRGSTVRYGVVDQAAIAEGCLLGTVEATLDVPGGPLAGVNRSVITAVMTRTDDGWRIRAFHNTLVAS
jgi:uncharacterized protein (TIGR02246 family)